MQQDLGLDTITLYPWAEMPFRRMPMSYEMKVFLVLNDITNRDICKAIPGLSEPFLSLLLTGQRKSNARLDQIAAHLGISREKLDSLIEGGKKGVPYAQLRTRGQRQAVPVDRSTNSTPQAAPVPVAASTAHHVNGEI